MSLETNLSDTSSRHRLKLSSRYHSFDLFKLIAAFMVVLIHAKSTEYSFPLKVFSRTAVPFFLMITGFYFESIVQKGNVSPYLRKIGSLMLTSFLFYYMIHLALVLRAGGSIVDTFSLSGIVQFFAFHVYPFGMHLWYFPALLYAFVILLYIKRKLSYSLQLKLMIMLFMCMIVMSFFCKFYYYRNFLFFALPFLMLGNMVHHYKQQVLGYTRYTLIGLLVSLFLVELEAYTLKYLGLGYDKDIYFFLPVLAFSLFLLALRYPTWGQGSPLAEYGKRYSPQIYIWHIMCMTVVSTLSFPKLGGVIQAFAVFLITLVSVIVGTKCIHRISHRFQ